MKNSKLIALLSAGALVLSSFSGLAVSGNSALAAGNSSARQRFSDGYFQDVVTYMVEGDGGAAAQIADDEESDAANRLMGEAADQQTSTVGDNYTGFLKNWTTPIQTELNGVYGGTGYWRDNDGDVNTDYNFVGDRSGKIHNQEVYAIWQKGFVGDRHVISYLEDPYDTEERLSAPTNEDQVILLQTGEDDPAGSKAPAYKTTFVALTRDSADVAPNALEKVVEGPIGTFNDHGIRLWGVEWTAAQQGGADATYGITLEIDAKVGHYTQWNGYIWAGTNGADDDGEYLPVHIAYPAAIQGDDVVLYGGEPSNYDIAEIIKKDLPHDQWVWVIADDNTDSFEFTDGSKSLTVPTGTAAPVRAKATATKAATCTLKLYNTRVDDKETFVWEKKLAISDPNFYTNIYIRNDLDKDGTFENFANSTFTTNEVKAELRATAEMLINEGATNIPQNAIRWTWTRIDGEKDDVIRHTVAGPNSDLCTFEVVGGVMPETPITTTYLVRAYDVDDPQTQFVNGGNDAREYMYGSRTITVVFDKSFEKKDNVDSLTVGTSFEKDGALYTVTGTDTVKFAKYIGTDTVYTVPATVSFDNNNTTYTFNVTAVGKKAFASKTQLKEVTVPASVTEIENGVFKNCKKLTSVTFLGAITQPAKNVFLKAGKNGGKKLKVSLAAGTSDDVIKAMKKSNKNAKIK